MVININLSRYNEINSALSNNQNIFYSKASDAEQCIARMEKISNLPHVNINDKRR